jgi:hypothetical protein
MADALHSNITLLRDKILDEITKSPKNETLNRSYSDKIKLIVRWGKAKSLGIDDF